MNISTTLNNIPVQTSSSPSMAAKHKKNNHQNRIQRDNVEITGHSKEKLITADDMAKASRGSQTESEKTSYLSKAKEIAQNVASFVLVDIPIFAAKAGLAMCVGGALGAGLGALMNSAPYVGGFVGSLAGMAVGSAVATGNGSGLDEIGTIVVSGAGIAAAVKTASVASTMPMAEVATNGAMLGAAGGLLLWLSCRD